MIPVQTAHLQVAAITHPGMRGKNNEDRFTVSAFKISEKDPTPTLLAIIADGVGGHRAGEVAADLAVTQISQVVASSDASQPLSVLQIAFEQANQAINARSMADPALSGMGTTCVCAWVIDDRLFTASVGDSRIYLVRNGKASQLTIDHTWVQEAIDSGILTPEQARNHPNAHVIRRHLGSQQPVVPDFRLRLSSAETDSRAQANQGMHLAPGDIVLLCSDGLTDLVRDDEIGMTLSRFSLSDALQDLVDQANARGGHDNISIVAVYVPSPGPTQALNIKRRRRWFWVGLLGLLVLAIAALSTYLYWLSVRPHPTPTPLMVSSQAPLVVPTLIPSGTPLLDNPSPTQAAAASATLIATTIPPKETSPAGQATITPWPTSTGQGTLVILSP